MKIFVYLWFTVIFLASCSEREHPGRDPQKKDTTLNPELIQGIPETSELVKDTIPDLERGDCFELRNEKSDKGLLLVKIRPDIYDFVIVTLDLKSKGLKKFLNGKIRMIPVTSSGGEKKEYGFDCVVIRGQADMENFLKSSFKAGRLRISKPGPVIGSSSFLYEYSGAFINKVSKENEEIWNKDFKIVNVAELTVL